MTTSLFTTLFDEVLADVPGVPQPVALNAIRNAAIEFCEKSGVWVVDADPISSIANQSVYQFEPENGAEVVGVVQAYYNGTRIDPMTAEQLDAELAYPWNEQSGIPTYYMVERPDEFVLAPYPSESLENAIKMKLSFKPTRTTTGMEAWVMDKYFETIAHGAKARLCAMHSKPWSNMGQAAFHAGIFDKGITGASLSTSNTKKLPAMVSAPSPI